MLALRPLPKTTWKGSNVLIDLTDRQAVALVDMIDFYRSSGFGCADLHHTPLIELTDEAKQHVRDIREIERQVRRQVRVAEKNDQVTHRDRPDLGTGKVVGRKNDGRPIVEWPDGQKMAHEAHTLLVVAIHG